MILRPRCVGGSQERTMATYVLVHGAYQGGWI